MILKKGGHFEKRNRPKINLDEIVEEKFIRDLVKRKLSYHAILVGSVCLAAVFNLSALFDIF